MILKRKKTWEINIGSLKIGGENPIVIQSMCDTKTHNVEATVQQILNLEKKGCELIRVAVPEEKDAKVLTKIIAQIHIPLVADIHFLPKMALLALDHPIAKLRINPGNFLDKNLLKEVIAKAKDKKVAIRIGVNAGSLEQKFWNKYKAPTPQALVESALESIKFFEKENFQNLIISVKTENVLNNIQAYRLLSSKTDYPLHLGVTHAGDQFDGTVKNSIGIGALIADGIGDTIRVSLAADPIEEIKVCKMILKSFKLYTKEPDIIACPTCGRISIDLKKILKEVKEKTKHLQNVRIAVMGCEVNGPGEARESDFGITGSNGKGIIFKKGKIIARVPENEIVDKLIEIIEKNSKF
ncbi:MAG: 4-hydroxy-3-methylbut-2-en-1-yl diphosphate synthase, (E)-4-hydroxy-3-methylbut-2-enyl-diphosphate synthase [Candidatus Peregrinibacteria bacterium GW2011_GWF2_33_10]|nr:MAG: 4-hydroxy-3-methylbut-2-en-1-yl diphosphate synthase, (E)-4-hydroxy-3-methylbut-2-enyl-diphosphate synthase [Candidatus Peregrinibacteria bacterium GW2011_GWF2_33_10]OGJ44861.1 MAG: 4-hydroxy-3-methylbut-2-en-1-yl diphosphate synthase [Candidatus Peregrinibacteria bacterium RIFOXYA2_FULL_33_21]OGJ47145.1 MAG: 4-hydroxy-3-methylbut-2-en-1-yl diphosphate synthase [Candidatus Peregrinibacteria bacterium RIFOXYA12_FULL_33_12]OGJ50563.1 MAG: 4-hydroxy-3-methylbut-2-en-1-yl diphosphate synthas